MITEQLDFKDKYKSDNITLTGARKDGSTIGGIVALPLKRIDLGHSLRGKRTKRKDFNAVEERLGQKKT